MAEPIEYLKSLGLKVIEGKKDGNEFYRHISKELYDGDITHPKSARKEICSFEKDENWISYFQLFSPTNFTKSKKTKEMFLKDLSVRMENFEPPSFREIYASATKLRMDIYICFEVENPTELETRWKWYEFSPIDGQSKSDDKYLMFFGFFDNGKFLFSKLEVESEEMLTEGTGIKQQEKKPEKNRPDFLKRNIFSHSNCHPCRFKNAFPSTVNLRNRTETTIEGSSDTDSVPENWCKDTDFYATFSLFRCISKELYGTDIYHNIICEITMDFELSEDYAGIFSGFTDVSNNASEKEKIRVLTQKMRTLCDGRWHPNEAEIFAIASILKTPIFVCKDFKWEMYSPLATNVIGNSYIALQRTGNTHYRLYPRTEECTCQLSQPLVMGHVGQIQQNLVEYIDQFLAKEGTCCLKSRHKRHIHLDHVVRNPAYQEDHETRNPYVQPIDNETQCVLQRLKMENKILDQISQGGDSIFHCLSKEIYGTEKHFQMVEDEMNRRYGASDFDTNQSIQAASDFVSRPVYVFGNFEEPRHSFHNQSLEYTWKCFIPENEQDDRLTGNHECRYYITLYWNNRLNRFDRIVPKIGCNCQYRPPVSLIERRTDGKVMKRKTFKNISTYSLVPAIQNDGAKTSCKVMEYDYRPYSLRNAQKNSLEVNDIHEPMVEFFLDDLKDDDFKKDERNIVMPHPFYETYHVITRQDMHSRCIDQVKMDSNSFYRCLSKEIFGTELNFAIIREKVCLEMEQCKDVIGHILCDRHDTGQGFLQALRSKASIEKGRKEKAYKCRLKLVKNDSEADDVEILAAASFLQTPIYVLCLGDEGRTSWMKFEQLRRKTRPSIMPKRRSHCRKTNMADKYYVTILRTSTGHYDRIVPRVDICNCLTDAPQAPSPQSGVLPTLTQSEIHCLKIARNAEKCLSRIIICLNDWLLANQMMIELCDLVIDKLEGRRKNVNIATIAGSATGLIGGVLAIAGLAAGPVTFGASFGLTIAGGVIGGIGGLTTTGSKLTEAALLKEDMSPLSKCRDMFQKRVEVLQTEMYSFKRELQKLDREANDFLYIRNQDSIDPSRIQSLLGLIRAIKSFVSIPLVVVRISLRAATIANAVLVPLAVVFDIGFIAHAVWNLFLGSKTEVSENLRRVSNQLKAAKTQMLIWSHGNLSFSSRNPK